MRVMVISAHPDDEAIGCGGTIYKHVIAGDEVECLFLTSGEAGCPGEDSEETRSLREHEAFEASNILGSRVYKFLHEPDGGLLVDKRIAMEIAKVMAERKPSVVYVTGDQDAHPDHKNAAQLLRLALEHSIVHPECWMTEVWTPLAEYDRVEDITEFIGVKLKAIRKHESQVKRQRFDEAALSLARFRGELHNRPHGPYAEVFKRL